MLHSKRVFLLVLFNLNFCFLSSCAKNNEANSKTFFNPEKPTPRGQSIWTDLRDFADIVRDGVGRDLDGLLDDPSLTAVTTEFGPSIINTQALPLRSAVAEAHVKPWSSWWYPKKDTDLYNSDDSALGRYDKINHTNAADFERKSHNPNSQNWEGMCHRS